MSSTTSLDGPPPTTEPELIPGAAPPDVIFYKDPFEDEIILPAVTEPSNENFTDVRNTTEVIVGYRVAVKLCGTQAFCGNISYQQCGNFTLQECDRCNMGYAALFAVFCIILGLLVLVGNSLVIWSVSTYKVKSNFNKIKASLAVADLFTAINLLVVVLYNFSWSITSTPSDIKKWHLEMRGSPQAISGGIFFLLGYAASLYHLVYLGIQRFYAIVKPIKYSQQSDLNFNIGVLVIWILAIVISTSPLWFQRYVTFVYYSSMYLYFPAPLAYGPAVANNTGIMASLAIVAVFTILPYVLMTVLTVLVFIYIRRRAKKSRKIRGKKSVNQREVSVYISVALMQIGYTVTLVPVIVAECLFFSGYLNCDTFVVPYLICFYLSMTNSLVNVLIYSVRDDMFKEKMRELFHFKHPLVSKSSTSSKQTQPTNL